MHAQVSNRKRFAGLNVAQGTRGSTRVGTESIGRPLESLKRGHLVSVSRYRSAKRGIEARDEQKKRAGYQKLVMAKDRVEPLKTSVFRDAHPFRFPLPILSVSTLVLPQILQESVVPGVLSYPFGAADQAIRARARKLARKALGNADCTELLRG